MPSIFHISAELCKGVVSVKHEFRKPLVISDELFPDFTLNVRNNETALEKDFREKQLNLWSKTIWGSDSDHFLTFLTPHDYPAKRTQTT